MSTSFYDAMDAGFKKLNLKEIISDRIKKMILDGNYKEAAESFRFLMFEDSCKQKDVEEVLVFLEGLPYQKRRPAARMIRWVLVKAGNDFERNPQKKAQWILLQRFAKYIIDKTVYYALPRHGNISGIDDFPKVHPSLSGIDFLALIGLIPMILGGLIYFNLVSVLQAFAIAILIMGGFQFTQYSVGKVWGSLVWIFLLAFTYLIIGALILIEPVMAALTLQIILGIFFLLEGILKINLSIKLEFSWSRILVLQNGITAAIFGLIVIFGFLGISNWVLGLLLGIDLLNGAFTMRIFLSEANDVDNASSYDLPCIDEVSAK